VHLALRDTAGLGNLLLEFLEVTDEEPTAVLYFELVEDVLIRYLIAPEDAILKRLLQPGSHVFTPESLFSFGWD